MAEGRRGGGEGRGPVDRKRLSHSERHTEGGEGGKVRPGPAGEWPVQNMVVSYLVLIVRLDSLGSTSHVALPWD